MTKLLSNSVATSPLDNAWVKRAAISTLDHPVAALPDAPDTPLGIAHTTIQPTRRAPQPN
jgi:hypothetical protein